MISPEAAPLEFKIAGSTFGLPLGGGVKEGRMLFQPQDFGVTLLDLFNGVPERVGNDIAILGADGQVPNFPLKGISVIIVVRNKAEMAFFCVFQHLGAV